MIQQPWSRAVLARTLGDLKPPLVLTVDAVDTLRTLSILTPMIFTDVVVTLTNASSAAFLAIYPVDASTVVLTTDAVTPQFIHLASALSPVLVTMTHTERMTYLGSILQALILSGWGLGLPSAAIGVNSGAETWVVNMENHAASQYDNFGYNSFAFDGTRYLAAADDGIYELTGTTDAGTAIESVVQLAQTAFGLPNLKAVPSVWIGAKSATELVLKVEADGESYTYTADRANTTLANSLVEPGRGLEGTYWTFTLSSLTPMELERITFLPVPLSRRI